MSKMIRCWIWTILLLSTALSQLQPQCAGRPFPSKIPLPSAYNQLINLDDYFTGNNLTYSLFPRVPEAILPKPWECALNAQREIGEVVASRYHPEQSLIVILTCDNNASFSIVMWRIGQNVRYQKYPLPSQTADRCTDIVSTPLNQTHVEVVADCRLVSGFLQRVLLWEELSFERGADWKSEIVDLFASVDSSLKVRLQRKGDYIMRAVLASFNSYIEVWSWSKEAKQLQTVLDKTVLSLSVLSLKQIKITGNTLILLDYYTGIHTMIIPPTFIPFPLASLIHPYYQGFTYDHSSNFLVLNKKGKVSVYEVDLTQSVLYSSFEGSYNLYKYEDVRRVIVAQGKMVVLGASILTLFSLQEDNYETRHAKVYTPRSPTQVFLMDVLEEGLQLLLVRNDQRTGFIELCKASPPLLTLSTPNVTWNVTIEARSDLQGHSTTCVQSFELSQLSGTGQPIYENGFKSDDEVLYVNLKGSGRVSLGKYGLGSRLQYSIRPYQLSKLQYSSTILKYVGGTCSIDNKPLPPNGTISMLLSYQELLLVGLQSNGTHTLRYHICSLPNDDPDALTNCTYATLGDLSIPGEGITTITHETMLVEESVRVVSQAFAVRMKGQNSRVTVRSLAVDRVGEHLLIRDVCEIKLGEEKGQDWSFVSQVLIQKNLLFVLQPYLKQIRVFQLGDSSCASVYNLTATSLQMGYFSPRGMRMWGRGGVLLVWQWDQLVALKLSGHSASDFKVRKLSSNNLPYLDSYTILTEAAPYLLLVTYKFNQIIKYHLDHKYQLIKLGTVGLDGLELVPPQEGGSVSVIEGHFLGVLIRDKTKNNWMAVYSIESIIPTAEEYLRVAIPNTENTLFLPTVSDRSVKSLLRVGVRTNRAGSFLECNTNLTYLSPSAVLYFDGSYTSLAEYSEPATLTLQTQTAAVTHTFKIFLSNVGMTIKRGKKFPPRGEKVESSQTFTIRDDDWFSGSVFRYEYLCRDCGDGRVSFRDKVWLNSSEELPLSGFHDLWWGQRKRVGMGGRIDGLLGGVLVRMRHNHSAWPLENNTKTGYDIHRTIVLSPELADCTSIIDDFLPNTLISLCASSHSPNGHILTLHSTASFKTVAIDEVRLQIEGEVKILTKQDVIVVYGQGLALLYTVYGLEEGWRFVQLDVIDKEDISGTICDISLLLNSTFSSSGSSGSSFSENLYFFMLTQCSSKIYYATFQLYLQSQTVTDQHGTRTITVPALHTSTATVLNLLSLFTKQHINIPAQAQVLETHYKFISSIGSINLYSILFVFNRFHMYQFRLRINRQNGNIQTLQLDSIYYKYGQYQVENVQYGQDHLMVVRLISQEKGYIFDDVLAVYDRTKFQYTSDFVKEYHIFWAHTLNHQPKQAKGSVEKYKTVPWWLTEDGLVLLQNTALQHYNISNSIHGVISNPSDTLYSQSITITARNPTNARTASVRLMGEELSEWNGWEIFGLVVGVLAGTVVLGLLIREGWNKYRVYRKMVGAQEEFLAQEVGLEGEEVVRVSREGVVNDSIRESGQTE